MGVEADLRNKAGATPLHVACQYGHLEVVRALLSAGAIVDLQCTQGGAIRRLTLRVGWATWR